MQSRSLVIQMLCEIVFRSIRRQLFFFFFPSPHSLWSFCLSLKPLCSFWMMVIIIGVTHCYVALSVCVWVCDEWSVKEVKNKSQSRPAVFAIVLTQLHSSRNTYMHTLKGENRRRHSVSVDGLFFRTVLYRLRASAAATAFDGVIVIVTLHCQWSPQTVVGRNVDSRALAFKLRITIHHSPASVIKWKQ